jgi:hypothetical protein
MKTEWGVEDNFGPLPVKSLEVAETMVKNQRAAGWESRVIWRGVTEWQEKDNLDD